MSEYRLQVTVSLRGSVDIDEETAAEHGIETRADAERWVREDACLLGLLDEDFYAGAEVYDWTVNGR